MELELKLSQSPKRPSSALPPDDESPSKSPKILNTSILDTSIPDARYAMCQNHDISRRIATFGSDRSKMSMAMTCTVWQKATNQLAFTSTYRFDGRNLPSPQFMYQKAVAVNVDGLYYCSTDVTDLTLSHRIGVINKTIFETMPAVKRLNLDYDGDIHIRYLPSTLESLIIQRRSGVVNIDGYRGCLKKLCMPMRGAMTGCNQLKEFTGFYTAFIPGVYPESLRVLRVEISQWSHILGMKLPSKLEVLAMWCKERLDSVPEDFYPESLKRIEIHTVGSPLGLLIPKQVDVFETWFDSMPTMQRQAKVMKFWNNSSVLRGQRIGDEVEELQFGSMDVNDFVYLLSAIPKSVKTVRVGEACYDCAAKTFVRLPAVEPVARCRFELARFGMGLFK